ncbi:tRNA lysidine(34) synthetase TilS [Oceanomicrobium pacificus]|uniref:tRNA(Ile)-lysidine synthase n=1 Tax=Oceanomicrobium pacificus TaxID=2692916 RepID=A0A6B0TRI9_9RHOB|nr:tRNA lysidine(34) synthetase TilS [Oceanomicrobium pacificus]MXU65319.1 tRNA lysidine(34) synthetase TilS [Oceanomicrobium pacificus]
MPLSGDLDTPTPPESDLPDLSAALDGLEPRDLLLAVSGGSDSRAMLELVRDWAGDAAGDLLVATVDHGLRPGSAAEARCVAATCAGLGIAHRILTWTGWTGEGNLQAAARAARRDLLSELARQEGRSAILLGHTRDDQAETVLMRLGRGAGVDGLSAMAVRQRQAGCLWIRPLLGQRRDRLRHMLQAREISWIEDPSNEDDRFLRIRLRQAGAALDALGLTVDGLADSAAALGSAREVLEDAALALGHACLSETVRGEVRLAHDSYSAARTDSRLRVLSAALRTVGGAAYRPRQEDLARLDAALLSGGPALPARTLAGCLVRGRGGQVEILREPARLPDPAPADQWWDGRWRLADRPEDAPDRLVIGALTAAGWRDFAPDMPSGPDCDRLALEVAPAIWHDGKVIAAPFLAEAAGQPTPWQIVAHPRRSSVFLRLTPR